jgi:hypothetical protein
MQTGTMKPMAVPSSGGRKIHVLGHEITLKLTQAYLSTAKTKTKGTTKL